ncbi:unnamed protein product [Rangifer tarandus platyrhynchus]|uniref:Uncharacterized protein n=1 Tax=Rangifer tarandus platyrhynchus TaxID=3082113 RepID=A0AC59ZAH4_RANTA
MLWLQHCWYGPAGVQLGSRTLLWSPCLPSQWDLSPLSPQWWVTSGDRGLPPPTSICIPPGHHRVGCHPGRPAAKFSWAQTSMPQAHTGHGVTLAWLRNGLGPKRSPLGSCGQKRPKG